MGDSHFNISITQGTVVKVLVIGVLAWALYLILDVVLIVLTAIVIASAIEPAVRFLMRRRAPRTIAVLVVYMFLLTLFRHFLPFRTVHLGGLREVRFLTALVS